MRGYFEKMTPVGRELKESEREQGAPNAQEITRRGDPENYSHLWGRPLRDAKDEIARIGRPLAPQSIEALTGLFKGYDPARFDEIAFVEMEMKADARLYRDPRFRAGILGTLEQKVTDYRL